MGASKVHSNTFYLDSLIEAKFKHWMKSMSPTNDQLLLRPPWIINTRVIAFYFACFALLCLFVWSRVFLCGPGCSWTWKQTRLVMCNPSASVFWSAEMTGRSLQAWLDVPVFWIAALAGRETSGLGFWQAFQHPWQPRIRCALQATSICQVRRGLETERQLFLPL